jgi:hypothetical protein
VTGRAVTIPSVPAENRGSRRILAWRAAALALLAIGIAIGSRIASPESTPRTAGTTSVSGSNPSTPSRPVSAPTARTRAGAVATAALSITAFDGDVLLHPERLRGVVSRIAATSSREQLIEAFTQASAQTRAKLGADTVPQPVIVLRSVPIGYRVERFSTREATVAVWYVGIVGSGATVAPQQSWRTQVVTLVWERGNWKVSSFQSSPGPTPPLSTAEAAGTPVDLFSAIPGFEEFKHAEP